jgi:hypothetical protein
MPDVNVERLSLSLSGLPEDQGRHLVQHIADGLAAATVPDSAGDRDTLQSNLTIRLGSTMPELADQIVADLLRQLERS